MHSITHEYLFCKAKREKKLRWKAERKALEEQERDRIDAEEAKLQEEERLEMLARAKALLFEQTDAMKTFRSAQRYSDILDVSMCLFIYVGGCARREIERICVSITHAS